VFNDLRIRTVEDQLSLRQRLPKKLFLAIAVLAAIVSNGAVVFGFFDYFGFNAVMMTAIISGITAVCAGFVYMLALISEFERHVPSIST